MAARRNSPRRRAGGRIMDLLHCSAGARWSAPTAGPKPSRRCRRRSGPVAATAARAQLSRLRQIGARRGSRWRRGDDRQGQRAAPEDASITDSLGWAQYKRGRLPQAIATLQKAAAIDPAQVEIHEHLGDALIAAGPAVRGALRLGSGDDRAEERRRQAAQGQARGRPDPGQRSALSVLTERATPSSTSRSMFAANCPMGATRSKPSSPFARTGMS